jgi:hypothetical protein
MLFTRFHRRLCWTPAREWLPALAKTLGAKALFRIPESLGGITAGDHVVAM